MTIELNRWLESIHNGVPVITRLAELIAVNGHRIEVVGQIGTVVPSTDNRYGRLGLTIHEAFELTYLRGAFEALGGGRDTQAQAKVNREIAGMVVLIPTAEERKVLVGY